MTVFGYVGAGPTSTEWQTRQLTEWCASNGYELDLIVEAAPAAADLGDIDPGPTFVRAAVLAGQAQSIVAVAHPSVLGDDIGQRWAALYARREGATLVVVTGGHVSPPANTPVDLALVRADRLEKSSHMVRRTALAHLGRERARADGRRPRRHPDQVAYGFRLEPGGRQVPDLDVQDLIAHGLLMRDRYKVTLRAIGEYWLTQGFRPKPPRGKARASNPNQSWTPKGVRDLLLKWETLVSCEMLPRAALLFTSG